MIRRIVLATSFILLAATAVSAQGRGPSPDANKDGFVSKAEHLAISEQRFAMMDVNKDGSIDKAEQDRIAKFMGGRNILAPADLNKDGKVSKDEFIKGATYRFNQADANNDGKLDAAEQESLRPPRR